MTPGLIERLEKAEGGSRELDAEIARLFGGQAIARFGDWDCREDGTGIWRPLPRYSSSLDAALALAERVCPDHHSSVGNLPISDDADYEEHHHFGALLYSRYTKPYDALGHGATRALAVCIAILKARATQEQTHG